MNSVFLAALIALSFWAGLVQRADARPDAPEDCAFPDGFLAFREAIGAEIVGDCESNQSHDQYGHAKQQTSEGTLFWDARRNLVSFHNGSHPWMDGPGGIASQVTIGDRSDAETARASVSVPAAVAFPRSRPRQ